MHKVSISRVSHAITFWTGILVALFTFVIASGAFTLAQGVHSSDVVVHLQPGINIKQFAAEYNTVPGQHLSGTKIYSLPVPEDLNQTDFIAQLQQDRRIVYAEADSIIQDEEVEGSQLHFAFDSDDQPGAYINQDAYLQVHLGSAHSVTRGAGVKVAVLDTGVLARHSALHGHLLQGYNALNPTDAPDDVPDGYTNFAVGHGTMITGLVAHIAPDAKILPIRVLNGDGVGTIFSVIAGIHYAVKHGAQVINMSFGAAQCSDALEEVVDEANRAGVVIVASAGNNSTNIQRYPAALGNVLAVASVESNNVKSAYSNFGEYIGIVAPGTGIRSTYWTGGYANWSGTSFAAPFVTATAALVFSIHPNYRASMVIEQIQQTAHSVDQFNPLYIDQLGAGIIDIEQAVNNTTEDD